MNAKVTLRCVWVLGLVAAGASVLPPMFAAPEQSARLPKVVASSSGTFSGMVILPTGAVRVFVGSNENGQLGDGTQAKPTYEEDPFREALLPDIADAVDGAAAENYFLLLRANGEVVAWGHNGSGQLGLDVPGTVPVPGKIAPSVLRPRAVPGLKGVRQLATGGGASFALLDDGTVRATGSNGEGLLGLGPAMPAALERFGRSPYFIEIPRLSAVRAIAAGGGAAFAVLSDGTVKAWGRNHHGLLGAEEIRRSAVPIVVPGLDDVVSVAASVGYALALRRDGTVLVWGDGTVDASNFAGATGASIHTEDAHPWTAKPLVIPNLRNVVAISAGSNAMALLADGTVRTWGYNGHYSMGLGQNREYPKGLQTPKLQDVASIASGWNNSSFVLRDGTVLQAGGRREGYFKVPTVIWPK